MYTKKQEVDVKNLVTSTHNTLSHLVSDVVSMSISNERQFESAKKTITAVINDDMNSFYEALIGRVNNGSPYTKQGDVYEICKYRYSVLNAKIFVVIDGIFEEARSESIKKTIKRMIWSTLQQFVLDLQFMLDITTEQL